jgi:putative glycosyltransferase
VGLWAITGFRQVPLPVKKHYKGQSTYNLKRKISIFVNALTSFSSKPLVYIFYLGCAIIFISGLAALYLIIRSLFFGHYLAGWPSLIVSIWLLGGLTIFCVGIIGIYLSKVFMEAKQRPYTIVKRLYEREEITGEIGDALTDREEYEEVSGTRRKI